MNKKSNPWDEITSAQQWKDDVANDAEESTNTQDFYNGISFQTVSGMVTEEAKDETDIINDMLSSINAHNASFNENEKTKEEQEQLNKEKALKKEEEKTRLLAAQTRYEQEQAERDARLFAEQEEKAKLAVEQAVKKEKSLTNRLSSIIKPRKNKEKPIVNEITEPSDSNIEDLAKIVPTVEEDLNRIEPTEEKEVSSNIQKEKLSKKHKSQKVEDSSSVQENTKERRSFFGKKKEEPSNASNITETLEEDSLKLNVSEDAPIEKGNKKEKKENDNSQNWEYLATHDEMTGLKNIRAYEQIKIIKRTKPFAIIYIDINNLKYANDLFSHETGNLLIKTISNEIKDRFPDQAYRTGGDEFVIIIDNINYKKSPEILSKIETAMHDSFSKSTKEAPEGVVISASIGYAVSDGKIPFIDITADAEAQMYAKKKAYKLAHPEYDLRNGKQKKAQQISKQTEPQDYDAMLSKDQQMIKQRIKQKHAQASSQSTSRILAEIQSRANEIRAILVASPTFDYLFIIYDVNTFVDMTISMNNVIDYSYLYVLYEGGPQYYGSDEYYAEITTLFTNIGQGILSGRLRTAKDYANIKGINIFKNIRFG